ncbi:MAG: hypothetical protein K2K00_07220 [Muribaculaceae bacterium]|nr:hypothetical protein [Muribaculaceae bacterium]
MIDFLSLAISMASAFIGLAIEKRLKNKIKHSLLRFLAGIAITVIIMLPIILIIEYCTNNGWYFDIIK